MFKRPHYSYCANVADVRLYFSDIYHSETTEEKQKNGKEPDSTLVQAPESCFHYLCLKGARDAHKINQL